MERIQIDFLTWTRALKGSYAKGVDRLRAILETDEQARSFAQCAGAVAVVLGVPQATPDENSEALFTLLMNSPYGEAALLTWLSGFYVFDSVDSLCGDAERVAQMCADEDKARAIAFCARLTSKAAATLAGLSCAAYDSETAILTDDVARKALCARKSALRVFLRNERIADAVCESDAMCAEILRSDDALAVMREDEWMRFARVCDAVAVKTVTTLAGLDAFTSCKALSADTIAMQAVAKSADALRAVNAFDSLKLASCASPIAFAALAGTMSAREALRADKDTWETFSKADGVVGTRAAATLAGLAADEYADAATLCVSSAACEAICAAPDALALLCLCEALRTVALGSVPFCTAMAARATAYAAVCADEDMYTSIKKSSVANKAILGAASAICGKAAAINAGLPPDEYSNAAAIAASTTAMQAVCERPAALRTLFAGTEMIDAATASVSALVVLTKNEAGYRAMSENATAFSRYQNITDAQAAQTLAELACIGAAAYSSIAAIANNAEATRAVAQGSDTRRLLAVHDNALGTMMTNTTTAIPILRENAEVMEAFAENPNAVGRVIPNNTYLSNVLGSETACRACLAGTYFWAYTIPNASFLQSVLSTSGMRAILGKEPDFVRKLLRLCPRELGRFAACGFYLNESAIAPVIENEQAMVGVVEASTNTTMFSNWSNRENYARMLVQSPAALDAIAQHSAANLWNYVKGSRFYRAIIDAHPALRREAYLCYNRKVTHVGKPVLLVSVERMEYSMNVTLHEDCYNAGVSVASGKGKVKIDALMPMIGSECIGTDYKFAFPMTYTYLVMEDSQCK